MREKRLSAARQRWKYVACDYATSALAFFLFNLCRFSLLGEEGGIWEFVFSTKLILEEIFLPLLMLGIYWLSGYYNQPFGKSRLQELITTFFSALINSSLLYLMLLINDHSWERRVNYQILAVLILLLFIIPYVGRLWLTSIASIHFKHGKWVFRTLIVGNTANARLIARRLREGRSRESMEIVGYLAIPEEEEIYDHHPVFPLSDVERVCQIEEVDQLVIPSAPYNEEKVLHLLYKFFHLDIPIKIAPDTFSFVTSAIHLKDIYGEPFVDLTSPAISESAKNIKRLSDILVSSLILMVFSPVYLCLALMVKINSKGPVIYSQERIGLKQKPFKIYKFRTMVVDAEKDGPQLAEKDDPRITTVGSFLRKYRLDELPQFWNVLKGEMSLVGPRPERQYYIEKIMQEAPYYALVYQVRPGITSWGMVKYGYATNVRQMIERTRYDLLYMSNMSLFVDLKILIYTIKIVFSGRGI